MTENDAVDFDEQTETLMTESEEAALAGNIAKRDLARRPRSPAGIRNQHGEKSYVQALGYRACDHRATVFLVNSCSGPKVAVSRRRRALQICRLFKQ